MRLSWEEGGDASEHSNSLQAKEGEAEQSSCAVSNDRAQQSRRAILLLLPKNNRKASKAGKKTPEK